MSDAGQTKDPGAARALTIEECIAQEKVGFSVGNRISLPFRLDPISVLIVQPTSLVGGETRITDFSPSSKTVCIVEQEDRTDIYIKPIEDLQERFGRWKGKIIVTCCNKGEDIFDPATHKRLTFTFRDDQPWVRIEFAEDLR